MSAPELLFLTVNNISNEYVVVDEEDFLFAEGETPDKAIASARIVTDAPIETYWGIVQSGETEIPEVGE